MFEVLFLLQHQRIICELFANMAAAGQQFIVNGENVDVAATPNNGAVLIEDSKCPYEILKEETLFNGRWMGAKQVKFLAPGNSTEQVGIISAGLESGTLGGTSVEQK